MKHLAILRGASAPFAKLQLMFGPPLLSLTVTCNYIIVELYTHNVSGSDSVSLLNTVYQYRPDNCAIDPT
jgi:hypothetical protein